MCEAEVNLRTKVNRDDWWAEDLIKSGEKLKERIGMKKMIEEISNREVESRVGDKDQQEAFKDRKDCVGPHEPN